MAVKKNYIGTYEKAALTMEPEQFREYYKDLNRSVFLGKALGLACRFRGVPMVKTLCECGAKFPEPFSRPVKIYRGRGRRPVRTMFVRSSRDHSLCLLNINSQIKGSSACKGIKFPESVRFGSGKTLRKISDSERAEVLKYLISVKERCLFEPSELLYYSILARDEFLENELKGLGIKLSDERVKELTGKIPSNKSKYKTLNELYPMLGYLSDGEFITAVNKLYELTGKKLRGSAKMIMLMKKRASNKEAVGLFAEKFDCGKTAKLRLMRGAVDKNDTVLLSLCGTAGFLADPKRRDALVEYSQKTGHIECTAWLLDHKNRTADLAAERERAERRLRRELNASPDSLTVLRALWSYKKLGDGAVEITWYKGSQTDITVPERIGKSPVTSIAKDAFSPANPRYKNDERRSFMNMLQRVTIPNTVTSIGENAFYGCLSLECVKLPDRLEVIPEYMFNECRRLNDIIIPESVKKISDGAFTGCTCLERIIIPDSVTEIGDGAFMDCISLEYARLPKHLKNIAVGTFRGCAGLKNIEIPYSVKSIGAGAFFGCGELKRIAVPEGVTELRELVFSCCPKLVSVTLPVSVEDIRDEMNYMTLNMNSILEGSRKAVVKLIARSCAEKYCKKHKIPYEYY